MTSKQRAYLRALSSKEDTIFQIGKNGIGEQTIKQIDDALEARELVKFSVLETAPEDTNSIAEEISEKTSSAIVHIIGSKIVLYRISKKKKRIILPD